MRHYVTAEFRDFVYAKYPQLEANRQYRKFFEYLCFSCNYCEETGLLLLGGEIIWKVIRHGTEPYDPHCGTFVPKEFLERFREDLQLTELWWSAVSPGHMRKLISSGFDAEMQARLDQEIFTFIDTAGKTKYVNFITGLGYYRASQQANRITEEEKYQEKRSTFQLNATQEKILSHLEALKGQSLFTHKVRENDALIRKAIDELDNRNAQYINARIISSIYEHPQIYYQPSSRGLTARLSGYNDSVVTLSSSVRKALCHGWTECDLRSSQFAILSAKLKAEQCLKFIKSGESLWNNFHHFTHGTNTPPPTNLKKDYKKILYSLCYGKPLLHKPEYAFLCKRDGKKYQDDLTTIAKNAGIPTIVNHPLLRELLELRTIWLKKIKQRGGEYDVWGRFLPIPKDSWEGSVMACVIQSIEMEIIAPIFDVAQEWGKRSLFQIVCFQHDGATLSFCNKERQENIQRKLADAVKLRAQELGVTTTLEFKDL